MKVFKIIGSGIIGLSLGFKLSRKFPGSKIIIFEKESDFGKHQSGRNSGVLHCGLAYKPNSLKANLTKSGLAQLIKFSDQKKVNYDITGKLVVIHDQNKLNDLENLKNIGEKNGIKGLKILDSKESKNIEPDLECYKSLFVPSEGIIDYSGVMKAFLYEILNSGGEIIYNYNVLKQNLDLNDSNTTIINCAGLYSDLVFKKLTNIDSPIRIIPFRGDYYEVKEGLFKNLIYPIPNSKFPFLGVHFTRLTNGKYIVGPNATPAFKREGYHFFDFNLIEFLNSATHSGLHKFIMNNFKFCLKELNSSFFKKAFIDESKKLLPNITSSDFIGKYKSGVRAQAVGNDGKLIMDFVIKKHRNQVHVLNAPSPGATSCMAISDFIINNYI